MAADVTASTGLTALVAGLADNKLFLGRRYAEWCTAAPTLESAVAAAAMAQDEIGHARSLYPLLREVAGASAETEPETRSAFTNAAFLDRPFEGWTDFIAANFLFDTAITVLLEAARESSFHELGTKARRMLEEEPLHWLHAEGWTRRLAARGEGARQALEESFARVRPDALDWFELATPELVDHGVVALPAGELRPRFAARVNPVLAGAGLPTV
jgi:phenylacetate-CoA oxygenase PaaI subunit